MCEAEIYERWGVSSREHRGNKEATDHRLADTARQVAIMSGWDGFQRMLQLLRDVSPILATCSHRDAPTPPEIGNYRSDSVSSMGSASKLLPDSNRFSSFKMCLPCLFARRS